MYKISVPVVSNTLPAQGGREKFLEELRAFDADRVFLAMGCYEFDRQKRREDLALLADNCRFFQENGLEVGAWIWTFQYSGENSFTKMVALNGETYEEICPMDEDFLRFAAEYVQDVAQTGVDIILFDDDFRYGFHGSGGPACLCEKHLAQINRLTGEQRTREEISAHITRGSKNKYRDAYLTANGNAFRNFAVTVRAAVDKINPAIRVGACACLTSWDIDGVSPGELSHLLAGNTKPLVRLIGAPYWAACGNWGNELQDVIELERMESAWTADGEIEILSEGDAYPRPRTVCPASFVEGFDTALRASGITDGILKYGIDYDSNIDYETGYRQFHQRNRPLYRQIDQYFGGKTACGVRVYEYPGKIADAVTPTPVNDSIHPEELFFSKAARTLAFNTIPTTYTGTGVTGICFDENARHLPPDAFRNGLILDVAAAQILTEQGIDVGIADFGKPVMSGSRERFLDSGNHISTRGGIPVNRLTLKAGAEILSDTETADGSIPMSFRYENGDGNRFLVLNMNTRSSNGNVLRHYARSRQYAAQTVWLSGKKLPAYVYGCPALYLQCRQDTDSLAVGLWNFFPDTAIAPVAELAGTYSRIEFIQCSGRLEGDRVFLSDIPPYGFAGFSVSR